MVEVIGQQAFSVEGCHINAIKERRGGGGVVCAERALLLSVCKNAFQHGQRVLVSLRKNKTISRIKARDGVEVHERRMILSVSVKCIGQSKIHQMGLCGIGVLSVFSIGDTKMADFVCQCYSQTGDAFLPMADFCGIILLFVTDTGKQTVTGGGSYSSSTGDA